MEAGGSSYFDPKVIHFFKVMLQKDIQTGKLTIPKKFVRKYGTHLCNSDVVLLKVPTGHIWEVQLRASDGVVRLEKGWVDFLNFYSIEHGDFLVFRYESGGSNALDVVMFNRTCTEVEYPKKSHVNISPIKVEDINEDDVTADQEARERQPSGRVTRRTVSLRTRTRPPQNLARRTSRLRNNMHSRDSPSRFGDLTMTTLQEEMDMLVLEKKGKTPSSSQEETRGALKGTVRAEALDRAKSFESSKPYFRAVMQPYYVQPPYILNMPGRFVQRYMGQQGRGEMKLHVSGSKIWTVGYKFVAWRGRVEAKAIRGWKAFVVDNGLVLGDVCVFELMTSIGSILFKITIFRTPRLPSSRSSQLLASGGGAAPSRLAGCSGTKSNGKEEDSSFDMKQVLPDGYFEFSDGKNNQLNARGFELKHEPLFVSGHPCSSKLSQQNLISPMGASERAIYLHKESYRLAMQGAGHDSQDS